MMILRVKEWHRREGFPVCVIFQPELPFMIASTSKHCAILGQDHRVNSTRHHLLGDLAVRERRNSSEGVSLIIIAQAQLSK